MTVTDEKPRQQETEKPRPEPNVQFVDTCIEHAYGSQVRLSFQIRVF